MLFQDLGLQQLQGSDRLPVRFYGILARGLYIVIRRSLRILDSSSKAQDNGDSRSHGIFGRILRLMWSFGPLFKLYWLFGALSV